MQPKIMEFIDVGLNDEGYFETMRQIDSDELAGISGEYISEFTEFLPSTEIRIKMKEEQIEQVHYVKSYYCFQCEALFVLQEDYIDDANVPEGLKGL